MLIIDPKEWALLYIAGIFAVGMTFVLNACLHFFFKNLELEMELGLLKKEEVQKRLKNFTNRIAQFIYLIVVVVLAVIFLDIFVFPSSVPNPTTTQWNCQNCTNVMNNYNVTNNYNFTNNSDAMNYYNVIVIENCARNNNRAFSVNEIKYLLQKRHGLIR